MNKEKTLLNSLLVLVPIAAIIGLFIPIFMGKVDLTILGSYLAIPMLLSVIIFYKIKNRIAFNIRLSDSYFPILLIIFNILFITTICLLYTFEERTIYFFLILTVMFFIVLVEILFIEKDNSKIILFQNIILLLLYIWSVNLNYHLFIGRTDLLGHRMFIESLIENFHVTDDFGVYIQFPLWHIEVSQFKILAGMPFEIQDIMFFVNGIVYCIFLLFIYKISMILLKNNKMALLSSLFASFYPDLLYHGMSSISKSVAMFFLSLLFFLILKKGIKFIFLSLFITLTIIMYHTVSIPFILLLFLIIYIINKFMYYNVHQIVITFSYIFLSTIIMIVYWSFNATVLYSAVIHNLFNSAYEEIISNYDFVLPYNELFNYLQYGILLLFILLGIYYVLNSNNYSYRLKSIIICTIFFVFLSIPGPILLIDKIASNFNFMRLQNYTIIFLALACSTGFYVTFIKFNKFEKSILLGIFLIFCLLSISNDFVASDNPLIERAFYTYYLTENEERSLDNLALMSSNYILSDYVSTRYYYYSQYRERYHIMEVSKDENTILKYNSNDLILLRKLELSKRPLKIYIADNNFILHPSWNNNITYIFGDSVIWDNLSRYNIIYSSNDVVAYI